MFAGGLPSDITYDSRKVTNPPDDYEAYSFVGCMTDVRLATEDDLITQGLYLTIRVWSAVNTFEDYTVHMGNIYDDDRGLESSHCGLTWCERVSIDDLYARLSDIINDPRRSKQAVLDVVVRVNVEVEEKLSSQYWNDSSDLAAGIRDAFFEEGRELPAGEDRLIFANQINPLG